MQKININVEKVDSYKFSMEEKNSNGIFFTTSEPIIESIISVIDIEHIENKIVFEPSCGNGNLIIALMKKIHSFHKSKKIMDNFLSCNLLFNDIDMNILNECISNIKKVYYSFFNTLLDYELNYFNSDFTIKSNSNLSKYTDKIDYIIGNPPYITLYGRRDKKKTEEQRNYFLSNYQQFPKKLKNGKLNYVMLFIEHSLDFLKNSGKLSFIIDASFNETAYKYTREYLLKYYHIEEIIHNISEFENVASGQLILKISNNKLSNSTKIIDYKTGNIHYKNPNEWNNIDNEYKFDLEKPCDITNSIVEKIISKTLPFCKMYNKKYLRTCTMLLNMEDKFVKEIDSNYELKKDEYYYYVGSKSLKDKLSPLVTNKVFYYNKNLQNSINDRLKVELEKQGIKNKKRIGLGDKIIFDNPKIFIRQSSKKIVCSFDDKPSAANNSLYVLSFSNNSIKSIEELLFLCGYLNSFVLTFFAQKIGIIRNFVGKQPQMKISDLHKLLIIDNIDIKTKISKITKKIYNKKVTIEDGIEDIDRLLIKFFNLCEEEIAFIKQQISHF